MLKMTRYLFGGNIVFFEALFELDRLDKDKILGYLAPLELP